MAKRIPRYLFPRGPGKPQANPIKDALRMAYLQRMLQKQADAKRQAYLEAMNAPPPGPGVPPLEEGSWSAAPGAMNTNVPYIGDELVPGYGAVTGGDVLYHTPYHDSIGRLIPTPYFDRGRNWASEAQWERYNDHGWDPNQAGSRLPDWLRTPGSGLGPAYVPSPEHVELANQRRDLQDLGVSLSALRSGKLNPELLRRDKERTLAYQAYEELHPEQLPDPQGPDWRSRINAGIYPGGPNWKGPPARANTGEGWGQDSARVPQGKSSASPEEIATRDAAWLAEHEAKSRALDQIPEHVPWGDPRVQAIMSTSTGADPMGWSGEVVPFDDRKNPVIVQQPPDRPPSGRYVTGPDGKVYVVGGLANIYGPYDDSQDRYADAPPRPSMVEQAYPENPQFPGPNPGASPYVWGAEAVDKDKGYIVSNPITRSGSFPEKFDSTPKGRQRAATILDFAQPLEYHRGSIPKGTKDATEVESGRPLPPAGRSPVGEDSPPPGRAPYLMPETPTPDPRFGYLGVAGGGGAGPWAEEAAAVPQGPPPPQMPEPGGLWDNYPSDFTMAMHSGDPAEIEKLAKMNPFDW